jgi:hypothetical protein
MAMGLGFLGRGRARMAAQLGGLHLVGAALGGAVAGGVLGLIGALLHLPDWRFWVIGATAVVASALAIGSRPVQLGRQCQVPRTWERTMPPRRRYLLWGAMLGCGVATPILSSAFLVLLGAQLTIGPWLGAVTGAVYGGTREAMALVPMLRRSDPEATLGVLSRCRSMVQRFNLVVAAGGGLALVLFAVQ